MRGPIDFERINAAALRNGRALLQQLIPGGTFRSLEYIVRNPRRDDKHLGSFKINYRSGQWADFAIDNKSARGGDIVSCYAYARDLDQSEAACQIAEKLGIPPYKGNGAEVGAPTKSNSRSRVISKPSDNDRINTTIRFGARKAHRGEQAEIRRHYYPSDGLPKQKVKIKLKSEPKDKWVTWYRIFRHGVPIGWQAKKPNDYIALPYVTTVLNPFDSELKADDLLWPEGEKDTDTLSGLSLPAFTFGGVGDGLPDGIGSYLKDRSLVILADNDDPGREHAEKKAAMAHASGAASIRLVHSRNCLPRAIFRTSSRTAVLRSNWRSA